MCGLFRQVAGFRGFNTWENSILPGLIRFELENDQATVVRYFGKLKTATNSRQQSCGGSYPDQSPCTQHKEGSMAAGICKCFWTAYGRPTGSEPKQINTLANTSAASCLPNLARVLALAPEMLSDCRRIL